MSIIPIVEYEEGLEQLANFAVRRKLIPFFGAGFTYGCTACETTVPNATQAAETMKAMILKHANGIFVESDLDTVNFFDLSELFFEYVPHEERAQYFEKSYTDVALYQNQIDFLMKINWPYAYTLNVDDGIERNSDFIPVLPYHRIRRPHTSKKLLYKLHGDALYESKYMDDTQENIVFSQKQYLQAITSEKNTDIYEALFSDYGQQHILFIGCNLQCEEDLQYIFEKSRPFQQETYRVVIRESVPNAIEQQKLKKHGINEIVLVANYEKFYLDFVKKYQEQQAKQRSKIYDYINPAIKKISDKDDSLKLLAGENIFNNKENSFSLGAFHVLRDAVNETAVALEKFPCVLLKGRRASGKTYVLCSLAKRYQTKDVFYFPSTDFADEDTVGKLFNTSKNGLFLFDSNSITPDVYGLIVNQAINLEQRNNKLVIAANSNDNFLVTKMKCTMIEVRNSFSSYEIVASSKALDSFGLTRRKNGQTNIDFLYVLKRDQNIKIPFANEASSSLFTSSEKSVLIALSALDKLYYSDLIALNFSQCEIETLCKKTTPIVELVEAGANEATRHSSVKLVHNSKLALIETLKVFTTEEISESIVYIVRKYKPDYSRRRLYIDVILFDTLNQLFSSRKNSKDLIATIYAALQPVLENDLHYWLQRAKSIYRTTPSKAELDDAYTYAKKAYLDGDRSLSTKAALTTSLISCALSEVVDLKQKLGYSEEAIILAHEAVFSEYFTMNPNYLASEIPIGKNTHSERRISAACNHVIKESENKDFIEKSLEILQKFDDMKKKH